VRADVRGGILELFREKCLVQLVVVSSPAVMIMYSPFQWGDVKNATCFDWSEPAKSKHSAILGWKSLAELIEPCQI
jgi:hypothetical protein